MKYVYGQKAKKALSTKEDDNAENAEETSTNIKQPAAMTLQTSERVSCKGEKSTLKLASWNINGIRAWITNGGLKYIEKEQPDIICFQVKAAFASLIESFFEFRN